MHLVISLLSYMLCGCGPSSVEGTPPPPADTGSISDSTPPVLPTGPGVLVATPRLDEKPIHAPDLAVLDDGRVFVTWVEENEEGLRDIFVALSDDHGASFSEPVPVAEPQDPRASWPHHPVVLATPDHLWIAFSARATGVSLSIFLLRASLPASNAFELVHEFTMPVDYHDMVYPRLALHPDGDVWIAWIASPSGLEGELWVARERFGWSSESITAGSDMEVPCECCPPDLLIRDDGEAWVAWRGDAVRDVFVARAEDPGELFGDFEQITDFGVTEDVCPLDGPRLLEVDGTLHAAMSDTHLESPRVWVGTLSDDSWDIVAIPGTDDPGADESQSRAYLAADSSGALHVGYETSFEGAYRDTRRDPSGVFEAPVDVVGPNGPLHQVQARAVGERVGGVGVDALGSLWFVHLDGEP